MVKSPELNPCLKNESVSRGQFAAALTAMIEGQERFSFLRLGDGELRYLLRIQETGISPDLPHVKPSCEVAHGNPGLDERYYDRLLRSYERCSLLDAYPRLAYNAENLSALEWRRAGGEDVPSGMQGCIVDWMFYEAKAYFKRHRCLICGAEADLLRELLKDEKYRQVASNYFERGCEPLLVQPRNDGATLSADLDAIKADLRHAIISQSIDTILLSLGGAAKILCYELAEELGIRALDIGAVLRGLVYSGSDGQALWRSSHHIQMVRVPFEVYIRALQRARPGLTGTEIMAKAHAQLCLELQRQEPLVSASSDANEGKPDSSPESIRRFQESYRYYRKEIRPLAKTSREAGALAKEFDYWRIKRGIGWDGRLFNLAVRAKRRLKGLTARLPQ